MRRVAVYTRVSTDMQAQKDFNSCDAQVSRIKSYIDSQEDHVFYKEYRDEAFSGSNLERPSLDQLLNDIKSGQVQAVITYKIDRLTRSLLDFNRLIKFFEKYGVSYISLTEHFDTSTAAGRLFLNIILMFAQYERELVSQRTKDKMQEKAVNGLWNGGRRPFGYESKGKELKPHPKNAQLVKAVFDKFLETGSVKDAHEYVKSLGGSSTRSKDPLEITSVSYMLRNMTYIGKVKSNGQIFEGKHEPLISEDVFNKAQELLKTKPKKKRLYKNYALKGLMRCGECGSLMTPTFTNKKTRRFYYYVCYKVARYGKDACSIQRINAEKVESAVLDYLARISNDNQYIENLAFRLTSEFDTYLGENSSWGTKKSIELLEVCSKNAEKQIKNALKDFKSSPTKKTQTDKALLLQSKIESAKLYKEKIDVVLSLSRDKSYALEPDTELGTHGGRQIFAGLANNQPKPNRTPHLNDIRESSIRKLATLMIIRTRPVS